MKKRIIAAAALLPLLLVVVLVLPKIFTGVLVGMMAAIGAYELLWSTQLVRVPRLVAYSAAFALLTGIWCSLGMDYGWAILGIIVFVCLLFTEMMLSHAKLSFEKIGITLFGGLVMPFLMTALVRIQSGEFGRFFIMIPFIMAFLSDTGAYFTGRAFGKHKLAPVISPNKTVEGVIGGVLGGIIGMMLYALILQLGFQFTVNYAVAALYGAVGSLAAVFGDLCFSVIKRQTGIKDYGNLIPGHGGILDRFDSMCVVAPLAEALLLLIPMAVKV